MVLASGLAESGLLAASHSCYTPRLDGSLLMFINNLNGFVGIVAAEPHVDHGAMRNAHPALDPLLQSLREMTTRYRAWAGECSDDRAEEYARLASDCERTTAELERLAQRKAIDAP